MRHISQSIPAALVRIAMAAESKPERLRRLAMIPAVMKGRLPC